MNIHKVSFALPSIVTGAVKMICSRKSITGLKAQGFVLLREVILVTLSDSIAYIAEIVAKIEADKRVTLINSIKHIGTSTPLNITSSISHVKKKEEPAKRFSVVINKDWLQITSNNIHTCIDTIIDNVSVLDLNYTSLCNEIINFSISILKHCTHSLNKSTISLLKLFFIPYFIGNRQIITKEDFNTCLDDIKLGIDLQDELIRALFSVRQIPREVDSQKQRQILCNCIGFSWAMKDIPVLTEDNLMSIHDSLYRLLEFNKTLIEEVLEPVAVISLNKSERVSFLKKAMNGSLMKLMKNFNNNRKLYDDFCLLLLNLPESIRVSLINYVIALLDFEKLPSNDMEAQRISKELILLKILSRGLKESQYKVLIGVMKYANGKINLSHTSKGDFHFILSLCLTDIISNNCVLKHLKTQEQNKLMLQLFEFLSSPYQNVKLSAELGYTLLQENLGTDLVEARYHALIDLLLQKIKYLYFESKTESALNIISSLIEVTPKLFARSLSSVLESLIRCFDNYYQEEFMWIIENYVPIFLRVLKYAHSHEVSIISTNLVRQILMRAKSLLSTTKNTLIVKAISLLRQSLKILNKKPMEREEAQNFSTEDPGNVSIPDSLTAIFYELWPSVLYQLQNMNNLPAINECLKICGDIAKSSPEFFLVANRFSSQLWPKIKLILGKHVSNQLFLIKTQISAVKFLQAISEVLMANTTNNESLCIEVPCQVFEMLMVREEDKEVTITAYQERLIQIKNESVILIQKLIKLGNEVIKAKCKEKYINNCKTYTNPTTIWMLCSSFMEELSNIFTS